MASFEILLQSAPSIPSNVDSPVIVVSSADGSETDVVDVLHVGALGVRELQAWGPSVADDVVNLHRCKFCQSCK